MKKLMSVILCVFMTLALSVNMFAAAAPTTPTWTRETTYKVDISDPAVSTQLVSAGDTFSVSFRLNSNAFVTVSDGTNEYATNPFWDNSAKMSVTVGGAGFTLAGSLAEQQVSAGPNVISILTDKNMEEGRHQLTLTVTCTPRDGSPVTATQTFNIDIEASSVELDEDPEAPAFTMTGASIPEGKGKSNLSTKLSVSFKNTGLVDVTDVKATISNLGELVLNTYTDTVELGDVASGDTFKVTFPIKFPEYPTAQTTAVITLTYKDGLGNEYTTPYNVFLQAKAKEKPQEVGEKTLKPKVIVSNYSVDVEKIVSGEEFTLTFVLKNTSHDKDVMNMTVDVNTSSSGSSGSSGQGSQPETVFSPIDGTTSFYTEKLDKDGEIEYTIKLKTSASAGAKSYPIDINYEFEYDLGGTYGDGADSMTINLPVTQPIKFELMEWTPPTECPIDGTTISFQYINKSKNTMNNLAVSVIGDFTMSTQFIGSLEASMMDFFNGTIVPVEGAKVGDTLKGTLLFTFEDASSNEQKVEYPIEATITESMGGAGGAPGMMGGGDMMFDPGMGGEMVEPGPGMPGGDMPVDGEGTEGGMSPILKWGLIIGVPVVVLIVIIIIVVAVKKRKAKLLEDDDDE